jgi:uncharacterized protein
MDEGVLTEDQCWALLRTQELGRLAFHLGNEVHLAPINYAVDGETLLFRTAEGSKLLGVEMNPDVAFEIDEVDEQQARSVILRGVARHLGEDEEHRVENLPLRPWVSGLRYDVVEIRPTEISGRSFELDRPWLHMLPG